MIRIEHEALPEIQSGRFRQKTRCKMNGSFAIKARTSLEQQYQFKRAWHLMKAEIQALEILPCTVTVSVRTVHGRLALTGIITIWKDTGATKPLVERVVDMVDGVVQAFNRNPNAFECSLDVSLRPEFFAST